MLLLALEPVRTELLALDDKDPICEQEDGLERLKELATVVAIVGSLISVVSSYNLYLVSMMINRMVENHCKRIVFKIKLVLFPLSLYVGYLYNQYKVSQLECGSEKQESLAVDAIESTRFCLKLTCYLLLASIMTVMSISICYQDIIAREEEAELWE